MKIGEVIQRVKSKFAGGVQDNGFPISNRHIYSMMISGRSLLLEQKSKKKQRLSEWNFQTLPYVEMERVSESDCEVLGVTGCIVLRSKHKLPSPLLNMNKHIIAKVTSAGREVVYDEISETSLKYQKGNRYTKSVVGYFLRGGHIYISYIRGPKVLRITAIFADPIEASEFPCPCEKSKECIDKCVGYLDREFYLDESLETPLITFIEDEVVGDKRRKQQQQQQQEQAQQQDPQQ